MDDGVDEPWVAEDESHYLQEESVVTATSVIVSRNPDGPNYGFKC